MSVSNPFTARLRDRALPALEELLSDGIPAPIEVALDSQGVRVRRADAIQVMWWPGESVTVRYSVDLEGAVEGRRQVVAVSGKIPPNVVTVEARDASVGVWLVPHDPALPGLASALDPRTLRRLLGHLGAQASDDPVARLRAYRPGRRAVVEVTGGPHSVFLKLVPPREVQRMHGIHGRLAERVPVPRSLGYDEDLGLMAMQALSGRTLRAALEAPSEPLMPVHDLDEVLEQLPEPTAEAHARSAADRVERVVGLLRRLVPEDEDRLVRLAGAIGIERAIRSVPVHGDFYEGQVLVAGGRLSGLLDVETFGWGRPGEDQATMIGHLSLWQQISRHPGRVRRLGNELLARWDAHHDAARLRRRAAAVVLSLATGPFRVQRSAWPEQTRRRIGLAESWVDAADRVGERTLTAGSSPSHGRFAR